ncbi:MarR family transcriptional regulator [Halobacillus sp. ACCC02827]|uniref:MarR family winged helix-turn-helix transcriptional regulator n=1 Tax=Bacillaceae TaxID=186817 RepID=UPI0002A4E1C8|nr:MULTISPECIES: MarR family transcriptional regulator [Bacillaceae]ELK48688.1 MarR family transcriptional regulator [Halobacillus sp. BAB-2008]QHT45371.1 MarR family transcriptional regulator [Bacillus sp. SB49]WJE16156.1 MarR family transcriptional regulator [Halobacillus sp. ACCC02827]
MEKKKQIDHSLGYNIHMVSHFLKNIYNERLGEYGLTHAQAKVIYFLATSGEQSQTEMQKRLHIQASSMNGLIESLLKHERILKRPSETDKRTKLISLTDQGLDLYDTILQIIDEIETEATEGLSWEEEQVMNAWLKKMQNNLNRDLTRRDGK